MTQATSRDYWISSTALYIDLNALGNPDYIQASCISGAQILVHVTGIITYDAGHNYRRWTLQAAPTIFHDHTQKYVYAAIPRDTNSTQNALVVFPSEKIDIYGKNASEEQLGSEDYYYIFLQGIISSSGDNGTTNREWTQRISTGYLSSDEAIDANTTTSEWYNFSSVDGITTFLKDLTMKAGTTFRELFAGYLQIKSGGSLNFENGGSITGVVDSTTSQDSTDKILTPYFGNTHYLSKTTDDIAQGHITFSQGLTADGTVKANQGATFGEYVKSIDYDDATQTGWGIVQRKDGKYSLNVTDLSVWGKAVFNNLTIRELSYVGGNLVFSPAASKIFAVKEVYGKNDETEEQELKGWKCYLLADDGTTATTNSWAVDDQARCETFNIKEGVYENVSNKTYWRRITKVSTENEVITDDDGNVLYDEKKFAWIQMSKLDCMENSDIPAAGDTIVLEGNRTDTDRQSFVLKETWGDDAPREIGYTGINSYSLTDKWVYEVGPKRVRFATQYFAVISRSGDKIYTPNYRGTYSSSFTYYYYDEVTWMGTRWLCVVPEGSFTATEPSENNEYWKATTAIIATKLELEHDLFSGIAKGETHTVTCHLMLGDTDCTKAVNYWGVARKTEDPTSDAAWATKDKVKNFNGSIDITWSNDGTEDDIGDGDMATFTFTAKTTTGDIYQQVLGI